MKFHNKYNLISILGLLFITVNLSFAANNNSIITSSALFEKNVELRWDLIQKHLFCNTNSIDIPVPAQHYLRFQLNQPIKHLNRQLSFYISNGSGIWDKTNLYYVQKTHSFYYAPSDNNNYVIRIKCANNKFDMSAYISRLMYVPSGETFRKTFYPYNNHFCPKNFALRKFDEDYSATYWQLNPNQRFETTIKGPIDIRLDTFITIPTETVDTSQRYWLSFFLDNKLAKNYRFEILTADNDVLYSHNTPFLFTKQLNRYIHVPPGKHKIMFTSISPVYMRLVAPTYRLLSQNLNTIIKRNSINSWLNLYNNSCYTSKKWPLWSTTQINFWVQHVYNMIWHNYNSFNFDPWPIDYLAKTNALIKHDEQLLLLRKLIEEQYRVYQTILPTNKTTKQKQQFYLPSRFSWQLHDYPLESKIMPESYLVNQSSTIKMQPFIPLPKNKAQALKYTIPIISHAQLMRIAVLTQNIFTTRYIFVQLNNKPARLLTVNKYQNYSILQPSWNYLQIGSQLLASRFKNSKLLSNYYALSPDAISDIEFEIPAKIHVIRIWGDQKNTPLLTKLQIQKNNQRYLSEKEYQYLTIGISKQQLLSWFFSLCNDLIIQNPHDSIKKQELQNNWLPIAIYIKGRSREFIRNVGPKIKATQIKRSTKESTITKQKNATLLEKLSAWSRLTDSSNKPLQRKAIKNQINILLQFNETYIAASLMRYYYRHINNQRLTDQLYLKLRTLYLQQKDYDQLEQLASYAILNKHSVIALTDLSNALLHKGYFRFALQICLIAPQKLRNSFTILTSAIHEKWWSIYNNALTNLPTKKQQQFWLGYKAQSYGNYTLAARFWKNAGLKGKIFKNSLLAGLDISNNHVNIQKFGAWYQSQPGEWFYYTAPELIVDYAGAIEILSQTRLTSTYFLATKNRPVILDILGPKKIRLVIRALPQKNHKDQFGYVTINNNGKLQRYTYRKKPYSVTLKDITNQYKIIGIKKNIDLAITNGSHQLLITPTNGRILVQAQEAEPLLPLFVLPHYNLHYVKLLQDIGKMRYHKAIRKMFILNSTENIYRFYGGRLFYPKILPSNNLKYRLKKQLPKNILSVIKKNLNSSITIDQAIAWLEDLSQIAQNNPSKRLEAACLAEIIYNKYPNDPTLRQLWFSINDYVEWQLIKTIDQSSGVYAIKEKNYTPDAISSKINHALIGSLQTSQHIVDTQSALHLFLKPNKSINLRVKLTIAEPAKLYAVNMKIQYGLIGKYIKTINLTPQKPFRTVALNIPANGTTFFAKILHPARGQYLKIEFIKNGNYLSDEQLRSFHLTSKQQPLKFSIIGPTLLRIDYQDSNKDKNAYRFIENGRHNIVIPPLPHQQTSPVRVFKRVLSKKMIVYRERQPFIWNPAAWVIPQIKQWLITKIPLNLPTDDQLPLGNQQNGTWNIAAGYISRFSDTSTNLPYERYFDVGIGYHKLLNDINDIYYNNQLAARLHTNKNNSAAFTNSLTGYWQPTLATPKFSWWSDADIYSQQALNKFNHAEYFNAGIGQNRQLISWLYHFPYVEFFYHHQSLHNLSLQQQKELDYDVYSDYINNHKYGMRVGYTITLRPWWDARLRAGIRVCSNEDYNVFKPDNMRYYISWNQVFRYVSSELSYYHGYYYSDADRKNKNEIDRIYLTLYPEKWLRSQKRLVTAVSLGYDPNYGRCSIAANLIWYFGDGRGLYDFASNEDNFKSLRQRLKPSDNLL